MRKKKVGRPKQGKQVKEVCSIRLEPKMKRILIKHFGTLQAAIDSYINDIKTLIKKGEF